MISVDVTRYIFPKREFILELTIMQGKLNKESVTVGLVVYEHRPFVQRAAAQISGAL